MTEDTWTHDGRVEQQLAQVVARLVDVADSNQPIVTFQAVELVRELLTPVIARLTAAEQHAEQAETREAALREELRIVALERDNLLRYGVPRAGAPDFAASAPAPEDGV